MIGLRFGLFIKLNVLDRNGGIGFLCKMFSGMGSGEVMFVMLMWRGMEILFFFGFI